LKPAVEEFRVEYHGQTENFHRFKYDGDEVSLRVYLAKRRRIPDAIIIDLKEAKREKEAA